MWPGWVLGNSDGRLVTMVGLVPIENDVIPMVLLVNMHFIKGTSIIFSQVTWENNLSPLNEMHIHQQNHWNDIL